jgi:hypothetical protein
MPMEPNTSVSGRMEKGTAKAPIPFTMETNTSVRSGQVRDGARHGRGTYTWASGSVKRGIWEKDQFIETFEQERQREQEEEAAAADARRTRKAVAREQREEEKSRRKRIYNACILDKSEDVGMDSSLVRRAIHSACTEISKNPSWLDRLWYN